MPASSDRISRKSSFDEAREYLDAMKTVVALVRDPVDRAYSHYQHEVALGREPLSFEEALAAEEERTRGEVERLTADPRAFGRAWWDHTYAARGRYAEQLERWLAAFPGEQLLVVTTEELGERPAKTYATILAFLGAAAHTLNIYRRLPRGWNTPPDGVASDAHMWRPVSSSATPTAPPASPGSWAARSRRSPIGPRAC